MVFQHANKYTKHRFLNFDDTDDEKYNDDNEVDEVDDMLQRLINELLNVYKFEKSNYNC